MILQLSNFDVLFEYKKCRKVGRHNRLKFVTEFRNVNEYSTPSSYQYIGMVIWVLEKNA